MPLDHTSPPAAPSAALLSSAISAVGARAEAGQVTGLFLGVTLADGATTQFHAGSSPQLLGLAQRMPRLIRGGTPSPEAAPAAWYWCDITGQGERWEIGLAVAEDCLWFPRLDFEDCLDDYSGCPCVPLVAPDAPR